jgi:hypothetical protein
MMVKDKPMSVNHKGCARLFGAHSWPTDFHHRFLTPSDGREFHEIRQAIPAQKKPFAEERSVATLSVSKTPINRRSTTKFLEYTFPDRESAGAHFSPRRNLDDYERMRCHVTVERKYIAQLALSAILISPNVGFISSWPRVSTAQCTLALLSFGHFSRKLSVGTIKTGETDVVARVCLHPGPLPPRTRVFFWNHLRNSKFVSPLGIGTVCAGSTCFFRPRGNLHYR